MKLGVWTVVVLLASLVREGQVLGEPLDEADVVPMNKRGDMSLKFLSIAATSSMKKNLATVNATISGLVKSVNGLMTPDQTKELKSAADILKQLVQQSVTLSESVTGALSKLILEPTTPINVLFQKFADVVQSISQYLADEQPKIVDSIKEMMGCVRAQQFLSSTTAYDKLLETANIVAQIGQIVFNSDELRLSPAIEVNPPQLKNLVAALAQNIKDLNDGLAVFVTAVKSTVKGIEMSNSFLKGLISMENVTRIDFNSTAIRTKRTANTQLTNVQNKYEAARLAMMTNLVSVIKSLNIFSGSKKLKSLVEDSRKAYLQLYRILKSRSQSDLVEMGENYSHLGNRTAKSINRTVEIFIDAVHRTGLRLADVLLEGSPHADSCYTTYSTKFVVPFTPLSTFVSNCVLKETTRWTTIATTVDDILRIARTNSQELSTNLGRCSSKYVNFRMISEDYAQANACLKTNLEDLHELPKEVGPLLQTMNQLVKQATKTSIFRMENCLATSLHEAMAELKFMRSAIAICAGPFDGCSRNNHDDDEKEWLVRERDQAENV